MQFYEGRFLLIFAELYFITYRKHVVRLCPYADVLVPRVNTDCRNLLLRGGALQHQYAFLVQEQRHSGVLGIFAEDDGGNEIKSSVAAAFSDICDHQSDHGMVAPVFTIFM